MRRAVSRRCPYYGSHDVFDGYFTLRDQCPTCGVTFEREEGYFLGGYALNLVVAEVVALSLAIVLRSRSPSAHEVVSVGDRDHPRAR